jgi:hypothetical protein
MEASVIAWILGSAAATGLAVRQAAAAVWKTGLDAQKELVESLKRQALSSETARIAADAAKSVAERRAGELEMRYAYMKKSYKQAVEALNKARVWVDPGAMVGAVSEPPAWDDPSAVWHVEGAKQADYFLGRDGDREEAERRRQRPLNPDAERRERERLNKLSREYLDESDSSNPPPRR